MTLKTPPTAPDLRTAVVDDIRRVCEMCHVRASELTESRYLKHAACNREDLALLGGFRKIVQDAWPMQRDLVAVAGMDSRQQYVRKLEKHVGENEYFSQAVAAKLIEAFKAHPIPVTARKPRKPYVAKAGVKQREIVGFLSDTHFGLRIDPEEVPVNAYDWTIAGRRMAKFANQLATFKEDHRTDTPRLRLCLGGDLTQGIIHLSDENTDVLTRQLHGASWILTQMIDYLREAFPEIVVECTPDNHMRMVHKGGDRQRSQKYDSYATVIYTNLQQAFRTFPDVKFHIPKTPYTEFNVLGHNFFMTHGDTVLSSGNVGKAINIKGITSDVRALQHAQKNLRVVMMGHTHVPLNTTLDNDVELILNGTASGTDPYAQSIGIMANNPTQVMFEATEAHPVGDFRKVSLKDADSDAAYDELITPYDGSFNLPPARK